MSDFYDYEDAELRMRIPRYLRSKGGVPFFAPFGKNKKNALIYAMAVSFIDNQDGIDLYQSQLSANEAGKEWDIDGVKTTIVKKGKSNYVEDGIEVLSKSYTSITRNLLFDYSFFFKNIDRHIYVSIGGQRDQEQFEKECQQIVSSIELKIRSIKDPSVKSRSITGGLKRADKARLSAVLDGLPPELAYMHKPILAIAREDQDLLGSGEADTGPIERALQKAAKSDDIETMATAHADLLRKWLIALPDHDGAWAAPAWFVEGFLRGYIMFRS